jgi:hypothetical protein
VRAVLVVRQVAATLGADLAHWTQTIIESSLTFVAVIFAWFLQQIISAFYSGLRGGRMFADGALRRCACSRACVRLCVVAAVPCAGHCVAGYRLSSDAVGCRFDGRPGRGPAHASPYPPLSRTLTRLRVIVGGRADR